MIRLCRVLLLLSLLLPLSCDTTPAPAPLPAPAAYQQEPTVRIRVAADRTSVQISGHALTIGPGSGRTYPLVSPVTVTRNTAGFIIAGGDGRAMRWAVPTLTVQSGSTGGLILDNTIYPGVLVLSGGRTPDRIDVINHAGLETYLAGVLEHELYRQWHPTTFRAQAIAARSYALVQMHRNRDRAFDMESTVASQVYGGASAFDKATEAVEATRGLVLTWSGKIVPGYYSSASGGTGQDAAAAFPGGPDIPPLRGREHGGWSRESRYFRWGPINADAAQLARRVAGWGAANRHPVAGLRSIRNIQIVERNSVGRPTVFRIDDAGRSYRLGCEQFRFACNFNAPGLPEVRPDAILRSSHVNVRVVGQTVQFWDGRGFGHGVGLDQHGAQAMAKQGYDERSILAFYYPGATIARVY